MADKRISAEELELVLAEDFHLLAEEIADAMNSAKAGSIIADSEELVRDANAEFRQQAFQKALRLLQEKQEAFSPSAQRIEKQGQTGDDSSDD